MGGKASGYILRFKMTRTQIINAIAKKINATSYLEIGTREGKNFNAIDIEYKAGVDPDENAKANFHCTSDEFFGYIEGGKYYRKFDIIFIDGLHERKQVTQDILNSLDCLEDGGYIICHDCNPTSELMQRVPRQTKQWTGDVWISIADLRVQRNDVSVFVVDTDYGVGIITKGKAERIKMPDGEDWDYNKHLVPNRKEILNLKTVNEFKQWLKK